MNPGVDLVALDVGTTKVCTLVGRTGPDGEIHLRGFGVAKAQGLRKGVVADLEAARDAVRESVQEAERSSGVPIKTAYVGVTGAHILSTTAHGETSLRRTAPITNRSLLQVRGAAEAEAAGRVLHAIPLGYAVDGQPNVTEPLGMHGSRLRVKTHIVSSPPGPLKNLEEVVTGAGVYPRTMVLESLAGGEAVLTAEEREAGVAIVDIGGGTTDIAVFQGGRAVHTAVLPVAGYQITNDIAIGLSAPFLAAEELKVARGQVFPLGAQEAHQVPSFGVQDTRRVTPLELSLLIRERLRELFRIIAERLGDAGSGAGLPAGLVLAGGTADLTGLERLGGEVLRMPVRVGYPTGVHSIPEELTGPAFATAVGLLLWAQEEESAQAVAWSNGHHRQNAVGGRVRDGLRALFMLA